MLKIVSFAVICFGLFFFQCAKIVAGGGTEDGNSFIVGCVMDTSGIPASGVTVYLCSHDYLAGVKGAVEGQGTIRIDTTMGNGFFRFDSVTPGAYTVEASGRGSMSVFARCSLGVKDSVLLGQMKMSHMSIRGGAVRQYGGAVTSRFVQVYGLNRVAVISQADSFTLEVPDVDLVFRFSCPDTSYPVVNKTILNGKKDSVVVPILSKYAVSDNRICDTLIVRIILDTNGLYNTPISSVVSMDDAHISDLKISGSSFTVLPSLIGGIRRLESVSITNTQIPSFPSRIGELTKLESLTITDNGKLETLPNEIANVKGEEFELDLSRNKLKNLPPEAKAWADKYDSDWESTQN